MVTAIQPDTPTLRQLWRAQTKAYCAQNLARATMFAKVPVGIHPRLPTLKVQIRSIDLPDMAAKVTAPV